jgi:hypothetical protein
LGSRTIDGIKPRINGGSIHHTDLELMMDRYKVQKTPHVDWNGTL